MKRTIAAFVIAVTSFVFAQQEDQKTDSNADFDKAVQVETMEGDLVSAVNLYGRAADNETLDDITRTRARYRMGLIYRKLGKDHDAERVLKIAAKGKGPAAKNAEQVLAGKQPQDEEAWSIQGRVHRSISKLYRTANFESGISELTLIGAPAVGPLVEAIRNEKNDLTFVKRGVSALTSIGGTEVTSWIKSVADEKDVFYRRTVLNALYLSIHSVKGNKTKMNTSSMIASIRRFILDSDVKTARSAIAILASLRTTLTENQVFEILKVQQEDVVASLLSGTNSLGMRKIAAANPKFIDQVAVELKRIFLAGSFETQQAIAHFARYHYGIHSKTVHHYFELMAVAEGPIANFNVWYSGVMTNGRSSDDHLPASKYVEFAKLFPRDFFAVIQGKNPHDLRETYPRQAGFLSTLKTPIQYWQSEDVSAMVDLVLMGFSDSGNDLTRQILRVAKPEQTGLLIQNLDAFERPFHVADRASWEDPNPAFETPLVNWVNSFLQQDRTQKGWYLDNLAPFVAAMAQQRSPSMDKFLFELASKEEALFRIVASGVTNPKRHPAQSLDVLRKLIGLGYEGSDADQARFDLWVPLYQNGDPADIPLLVEAGRRGLKETPRTSGGHRKGNSTHWTCGLLPFRLDSKFTPDQSASVFSQILQGNEKKLSRHVTYGIKDKRKGRSSTPDDFPIAMTLMVANTIFGLEDEHQYDVLKFVLELGITEDDRGQVWVNRALRELPSNMTHRILRELPKKLEGETATTMMELLRGTDDSKITSALTSLESRGDSGFTPEIAKLLQHENASVRVGGMRTLVAIEREKSVPMILPLATDPSAYVRKSLCALLGEVPERSVVPILVEGLRDPDADVRKSAEDALKRVHFYFDQKQSWDRFLNDSGLDATSAVSALLKQAKAGNDKAIRLIAIESLGTLAVPETLPILIQFMTENDAAIKAAAKSSIDKINLKASPKK